MGDNQRQHKKGEGCPTLQEGRVTCFTNMEYSDLGKVKKAA